MAVAELLDSGTLEHVATIARRVTGRRPSPATIWRWCKKGLCSGRVRLACAFHSGYWQTTEAAFREFIQAQTDAKFPQPAGPAVDDADLHAAGLL